MQVANAGTGVFSGFQGLMFFKKEDFSNYSSSPISFNSSSNASITISQQSAMSGTRGTRFAVLNDGTWYLSNTVRTAGITSSTTITINDLSTETWAAWSPLGTVLASTPSSYTVAGSTFTDIQAVGFYFDIGRTGNLSSLDVTNITFNAIPEPTTWALLAASLTTLVVFRRRRRV